MSTLFLRLLAMTVADKRAVAILAACVSLLEL